jgi:hypothetical protein
MRYHHPTVRIARMHHSRQDAMYPSPSHPSRWLQRQARPGVGHELHAFRLRQKKPPDPPEPV